MSGAFVGVDWGTTNLRAWRIEDGRAVAEHRDDRGVSTLKPGEAERVFFEEIVPAVGGEGLPALLCGMVGSDLGWREIGHRPLPVAGEDLGPVCVEVAPGVRIVPGVKRPDGTDLMRGEEVKAFGAALGEARLTLLTPGTHPKLIRMQDGRIVDVRTALTGELYALLTRHSTLRRGDQSWSDAVFDEGVAVGRARGTYGLFETRARVVSGAASPEHAHAFLSGLLIGAELAARESEPDVLVGDPDICRLYARALDRPDVPRVDGDAAVIAGLNRLMEHAS